MFEMVFMFGLKLVKLNLQATSEPCYSSLACSVGSCPRTVTAIRCVLERWVGYAYRSIIAAREDVNMIVPELRSRICGRTIRHNSTGERTLISIEYHQSSASVRWKGMKVFVPALQIKISITPNSEFTWTGWSVSQVIAQIPSGNIDTLAVSSCVHIEMIERIALSRSYLLHEHLEVLPLQPVRRHSNYFYIASSSFQYLFGSLLDLTLRSSRHAHTSTAIGERLCYLFTNTSARPCDKSNLSLECSAENGRVNGRIKGGAQGGHLCA